MNKQDVIHFFDRCAPQWDAEMIRDDHIIDTILEIAGVRPGVHVLDVACGTGVLFPDYLKRQTASVTAIDISPEMAKIAAAKYPQVQVLCGDVEATQFDRKFDVVMVYNAFPHFPNPAHLIEVLSGLVKPGGTLSVAHGMSRAALTRHHSGAASSVSIDLLSERALAELFDPYFDVTAVISNDRMYQVAGVRREEDGHSHAGHSHSHDHSHTHAHTHTHDHYHDGTEPEPMEELLALMGYMVNHNDAHAQEMAVLASQLRDLGKVRAYEKIMDVVSDFDVVNAKFDGVRNELTVENEE